MLPFAELPSEIRNRIYRAVIEQLPNIPLKHIGCLAIPTPKQHQLEEQREAFYSFASLSSQIYDEFINEHALSRGLLVSKDVSQTANDAEYDQQLCAAFKNTYYIRMRIMHSSRLIVPARITLLEFGRMEVRRIDVTVRIFKKSSNAVEGDKRRCFEVFLRKISPFPTGCPFQPSQDHPLLDKIYKLGEARFEEVVKEMVTTRIKDDGCMGFTLKGVNKLIALANQDMTAAYERAVASKESQIEEEDS